MGVAERREREREQLRARILDAARDLLLEQGLAGVSMRAIAERIEYSPATIYLYFSDKDELVRGVVDTGFERLGAAMTAELARLGETADAASQYCATGRAYARFAVENPAYFRVMFELPATARLECEDEARRGEGAAFERVVALVSRAAEECRVQVAARRVAVVGWGLIHGLVTLYLSGHLRREVQTQDGFFELIEDAMRSLNTGWQVADGAVPSGEVA